MSVTAREDLEEIRDLARSVATGRIAPYAAEVDEAARFPAEGYRALVDPSCTPSSSPRTTAEQVPTH